MRAKLTIFGVASGYECYRSPMAARQRHVPPPSAQAPINKGLESLAGTSRADVREPGEDEPSVDSAAEVGCGRRAVIHPNW